jgi:hypothetical protein
MFNRYHGFIDPSSNKKKTNKLIVSNSRSGATNKSSISMSTQSTPQPPTPQPPTPQPPIASGLPIITIPEEPPMFPANPNFKLPNIKIEDYKDIFEPKEEIKYIPPEIIPKEKIQPKQYVEPDYEEIPSKQSVKPDEYVKPDYKIIEPKQYVKPDYKVIEPKQYVKPDYKVIEPKQYVKPNEYVKPVSRKTISNKKQNFSSLNKYKINIDNRNQQIIEIPTQKKNISIVKEFPVINEFPIKTPEIISREKYIKPKTIKKIKSKKKSIIKPKTITKIKSNPKLDDVLTKIEMSDLDYKKKFEKLKKVYIKQHDSLINVFDGYQKLYEKVKEEEQIK